MEDPLAKMTHQLAARIDQNRYATLFKNHTIADVTPPSSSKVL